MNAVDGLLRDYRAAFLRNLARREESTLHAGYQLGRAALAAGLTLLDMVSVHHTVLVEGLEKSPPGEGPTIAAAASGFLSEVLASYHMAQRDIAQRGPSRGG